MFKHFYNGTDVAFIFRIAYVAEPQKIVASFIAILNFGVVCFDAFSPVVELIVGLCPGIGETEEVVLVATYR